MRLAATRGESVLPAGREWAPSLAAGARSGMLWLSRALVRMVLAAALIVAGGIVAPLFAAEPGMTAYDFGATQGPLEKSSL